MSLSCQFHSYVGFIAGSCHFHVTFNQTELQTVSWQFHGTDLLVHLVVAASPSQLSSAQHGSADPLGILPARSGGVSSSAVYSPDRIPSSTRVAKRVFYNMAVEVSSNGLSMQPAAAFLHQMQPVAAGKRDSVHARLNLEHSAQETTN